MNFLRMGDVELSDIVLLPAKNKAIDDTVLPFRVVMLDILKRAHFLDEVKRAYLYVSITYLVRVECYMKSGYKVRMDGTCTPAEFLSLSRHWGEGQS